MNNEVKTFNKLFDAISELLNYKNNSTCTAENVVCLVNSFDAAAMDFHGECLDICIDILSRVIKIPSVAIRDDVEKYKANNK